MPEWRNWQTHTTQNRAGNHAGSSPALGTILVVDFFKEMIYNRIETDERVAEKGDFYDKRRKKK